MGNNSSNPYPKYQFPYRQPVDFSWGSYIEFCSFFSELNINKNFQDNYRNRTIDLEGYITQLQKTSVKLLLNPSDAYSTNSEVTLHMKKEVLYSYGPDKFVLYQPVKFRGKFTSIGQIRNHQMELVKYDPNIRPELEITYEHFLSLFGSKAQKQADYYFNNYFRNRVIQVKGIVQGEIINMNYDQDVMKIPFHVINDNLFIPNEEVVLMIEKVQDPIQKQIFNRLKKLKYNTTVLLTVSIYSRGNPHVLKLISIDHVFTQDEQTKGQLVSVIGQTLMGGFNLWRNNKEKQEKMDQEKSRINNQAQQIKSIVKDNVEELKIQNEIEKQKMKEEVERMKYDNEIEKQKLRASIQLMKLEQEKENQRMKEQFNKPMKQKEKEKLKAKQNIQELENELDNEEQILRDRKQDLQRQQQQDKLRQKQKEKTIDKEIENIDQNATIRNNEQFYTQIQDLNQSQSFPVVQYPPLPSNYQRVASAPQQDDQIKDIQQTKQQQQIQKRIMDRLRRLGKHEYKRREKKKRKEDKMQEKRRKHEEKLKKREEKKQKKNEKQQKKIEKHQQKLEKRKSKLLIKKQINKDNNDKDDQNIDSSDFEISNISPVSELSPISDYPTNSPPSPSSSISDDSIDQYIQNDIRFQRRGNMQQGLGQQQIQQQSSSSQSSSSSQFSIPLNFNSLNTNNQMNQYERTMREEKEREIERERERRHVLDEGTDWAYNNNIDNNNTQQQMHIQQQSSSNDHPSQLPPSLMFSQQFGVLPIPSSFHQQQEQQYHPNIDPIDNSVGPIQNDSDVHQELTIDNYPSLHDLDVPNTFENEFIEGFICPITLELMTDPVLAEDGVYYEREAIVEWMKKKKQSPVTREVMTGKFFPDEALKKRIEEYRKLHPERANR